MNKDKSLSKVKATDSGVRSSVSDPGWIHGIGCYNFINFISEMREIRGLLLRPRRASRESLPPNPVSDTL